MGMIFNNTAEFGSIRDKPVWVNTMTQKAHIEVNKMGVQASSANRLFILVCIEIFKIMEGQSISKGCFLLSHHIRSM